MHAILERFRFVRLREKNILLIMLGILAIIAKIKRQACGLVNIEVQ